jgi:hypothetical protein
MKCINKERIFTKCNVSNTCNILYLSSVQEYMGGLWQLFCFPRKIVEFPIHFCLVYLEFSVPFCVVHSKIKNHLALCLKNPT